MYDKREPTVDEMMTMRLSDLKRYLGALPEDLNILEQERQKLINVLKAAIPSDEVEFITSGECVKVVIEEIGKSQIALLLGRYEYKVYDNHSPERALTKAILLREQLEKRGFGVVIMDPQSPSDFLAGGIHLRTLVISGWVK